MSVEKYEKDEQIRVYLKTGKDPLFGRVDSFQIDPKKFKSRGSLTN